MSCIDFATRGRVAVITINRPEARNAIDPDAARGLESALDRLDADDGLQVGVLTGAPPVFCAGADLKAIASGRAEALSTERGGFAGIVQRRRDKPLIAAVDGPALAGGTEIVLSCDLVVASPAATFGLPEVKRGLIAGAGALFRLPRALPANLAMEYVLTGDAFDAEVAHRHGLVNHLCERGHAVEAAVALAERIAANAPLAVRLSRQVMLESRLLDEDAEWARTRAANERILATEDVQEGVRAFVEKRLPIWAGR